MGALLAEICDCFGSPRKVKETADLFSLGVALGKQGETDEAEALYRMAAQPKSVTGIRSLSESGLRAQASKELDQLLRREGRTEERMEVLRRMCTSKDAGVYPHVEMAKIYEHRLHDIKNALRCARRAMELARDESEREELQRRIDRLEKKNARNRKETKLCL